MDDDIEFRNILKYLVSFDEEFDDGGYCGDNYDDYDSVCWDMKSTTYYDSYYDYYDTFGPY